MTRARRAAHFLLWPELAGSPPNDAIIRSLLELGYEVDLFAPGTFTRTFHEGAHANGGVHYGKRWLLRNALSPRWRQYSVFSATSEDPIGVAGVLAAVHRRPFFVLADEIKSGSYYGNSPESWKQLCRWAMRRAKLNIVNDESRVQLLRDYAHLDASASVIVYPGCFEQPPAPANRAELRRKWGVPDGALVIGMSGGLSMSLGADWLIGCLQNVAGTHIVLQPVNMDPLVRMLLRHVEGRERVYLEQGRLDWREAWAQSSAFDVGLAVYADPAPQFQHMGVSSNRLCMQLAMGVPVIATRQPSFDFIEQYDCGVLVSSQEEFDEALRRIRGDGEAMRLNALRCSREYINAPVRRAQLKASLEKVLA